MTNRQPWTAGRWRRRRRRWWFAAAVARAAAAAHNPRLTHGQAGAPAASAARVQLGSLRGLGHLAAQARRRCTRERPASDPRVSPRRRHPQQLPPGCRQLTQRNLQRSAHPNRSPCAHSE